MLAGDSQMERCPRSATHGSSLMCQPEWSCRGQCLQIFAELCIMNFFSLIQKKIIQNFILEFLYILNVKVIKI